MSFSPTFPVFVPSLSWQMFGFSIERLRKKDISAPLPMLFFFFLPPFSPFSSCCCSALGRERARRASSTRSIRRLSSTKPPPPPAAASPPRPHSPGFRSSRRLRWRGISPVHTRQPGPTHTTHAERDTHAGSTPICALREGDRPQGWNRGSSRAQLDPSDSSILYAIDLSVRVCARIYSVDILPLPSRTPPPVQKQRVYFNLAADVKTEICRDRLGTRVSKWFLNRRRSWWSAPGR